MKFEPVAKLRASTKVAAQIRDAILGGRVKAGEKLPSERHLAGQFNVNRATVREALSSLEQLGLVAIRHGGGVAVQDFIAKGTVGLLKYMLAVDGGLDGPLLADVLEARQTLGVAIAVSAARKRAADELPLLAEIVEQMKQVRDDPGRFGDLDFEFFLCMAHAGGNRVYIFVLNAIKDIFEQTRAAFSHLFADADRLLRVHHNLIEALESGDETRAADLVREYLAPPGR